MSKRNWVRCLAAASIGVVLFGLVALAASHPGGAAVWGFFFDLVRWSFEPGAYQFDDDSRLLNGISGGLLIGWGSMMTWLSLGPIARGDGGARRAAWVAIGAWFLADSLGSILSDAPGNIVLNVGILLLFAIPLLALGRSARLARVAA
ncbi:MAG: hypothetical protein FJX66_07610 [Alphaproteobacteria bacterium]|nr:hypothetical protein [Alphaproteobacteria bacterium]